MKLFFLFIVLFTFFHAQGQAIARITSPDQIICTCEKVVLSSSSSSPGSSPIVRTLWSINGPNGYNKADTTLPGKDLSIALCTPGTYDISIINQHVNKTTSVKQEFSFITVNASPIPQINASVTSCQVPFGINYTNTGHFGPGINASWTFQGGNPTTINGDFPPTINYTSAGVFNAELTLNNTLTGCQGTVTKEITVSDFKTDFVLPQNSLCDSTAFTLKDNSTIGVNKWTWTFENGIPSSANSSSPTVWFPVGTHQITLVSENTTIGCFDKKTISITILPSPKISFTSNPFAGCAPLPVTFTSTSSVASGAIYSWNFGDDTIVGSTESSPTHIYKGNGSFSPKVTLTAPNGCKSSFVGQAIKLESPVAKFSFEALNDCAPREIKFTDSSTALAPIIKWEMLHGDGTKSISTTNDIPNHTYNCGKFTPELIITLENGCKDTVKGDEIKVGEKLLIAFESDTLLQCVKKPLILQSKTPITCKHDSTDVVYNWIFEGVSEKGDSVYTKTFSDTMKNMQYATDVGLEIDFRGCKSKDSIIDYIYIKAPVSKFSLATSLFCDQGQQVAPLGKIVDVIDTLSIYGHSNSMQHSQIPPLGSNLKTVPNQQLDDVKVTYKWGDGKPDNVINDDALLEDLDKGAISHVYDNYGTFEVWQIIENTTAGCVDSTSTVVNISWIETSFLFDLPRPDSVCVFDRFKINSTSGTFEDHKPFNYELNLKDSTILKAAGSKNDQEFAHSYTKSGKYNVTLTTSNVLGCSATVIRPITALALPIADFALSQDSGCVGMPYVSIATNNSKHPIGSYGEGNTITKWASSNPFEWKIIPAASSIYSKSTQQLSDTIQAQIYRNTTIALTTTDGFGCKNTRYKTAVVLQPQAIFDMPAKSCDGANLVADAKFSLPFQDLDFAWYFDKQPDGAPNGMQSFYQYFMTSSGTSKDHFMYLVVSDKLGCTDTLKRSATAYNPKAAFSDQASGATPDVDGSYKCPPILMNFSNQVQSDLPVSIFQWRLGLNPYVQPDPYLPTSSSQPNPQGMQYIYPGTYDLYLTIQDSLGCVDELYVEDYLVIKGPILTPVITENPLGCGGLWDFSYKDAEDVVSWEWDMNDGSKVMSSNVTDNRFSHRYNNEQTYIPVILAKDANNCAVSYYDTIQVFPKLIDANFTPSQTEIQLGNSVDFDDNSQTTGKILEWSWNYGDGLKDLLKQDGDVTHIFMKAGELPVQLIIKDDQGCIDTAVVFIKITNDYIIPNVLTGEGDGERPNALMTLNKDVFIDFEITILNRWGNVVYEGKRDPSKPTLLWDGKDHKSGELCTDGTYFYLFKGTYANNEIAEQSGYVTLVGTDRKF